jgi:hypothetical protein
LKKGEVDRPCSVKATINPKVLTDTDNYVLTSNELDLKKLIELFNQEAKRISPILRDFGSYSLNRIDYCINFDLEELRINSFPEVYMPFIRQGDIPYSYTEYSEYDDKSHRKKSDPDSFYLSNGSVDINCYDKHAQLRKKYKDNPNVNFDMARYLIRFEIQCKYSKIQYLQKPIKDIENFEEKVRILLSDEVCTNQVTKYYSKTIGKGDYFTLNAARNKIISMNDSRNRRDRLIRDLEFVNQARGISKAKSLLTGHRLEDFKTSIKELGEIGINPVTIPRETGIKFLPNLMRVYLEQKEKEEVAFL